MLHLNTRTHSWDSSQQNPHVQRFWDAKDPTPIHTCTRAHVTWMPYILRKIYFPLNHMWTSLHSLPQPTSLRIFVAPTHNLDHNFACWRQYTMQLRSHLDFLYLALLHSFWVKQLFLDCKPRQKQFWEDLI